MSIKSLKPKFGKFKQGYYKIQNVSKYNGDPTKVIFRSSWERKLMIYCDLTSSVLEWSSEPIYIQYISPLDNKPHKYYIDFYVVERDEQGNLHKYLVEVKPIKDYRDRPVLEGKRTLKKEAKYIDAMKVWLVNNAKFKYADAYAKSIGCEFIIVNEHSLFGKK